MNNNYDNYFELFYIPTNNAQKIFYLNNKTHCEL